MTLTVCHLCTRDGRTPDADAISRVIEGLARAGLPRCECERLRNIRNDAARAQSVGARSALLWTLVEQADGMHWFDELPSDQELSEQVRAAMATFERSETGYPCLTEQPCTLSLAHSNALAVCAMDAHAVVGVDVEPLTRQIKRHADIIARYFSEKEQENIQNSCDPQGEFLRVWMRKEALGKARGTGLSAEAHLLDTESVRPDCFVERQIEEQQITVCLLQK